MTGGGINATGISTGSNIIGTALGDTITGGNGNDTITGGAGSDSMTGGAGNDLFVVGGTDVNGDTIQGNGDTDTLQLTATTNLTNVGSFGGVETLLLDEGVALTIDNAQLADVDAIVGTGDNGGESLSITASGGNDTIDLSASAFTLDTNDVSIAVEAGGGNDMVTLTAGNDSVNGGDGNDTIIGGAGADTINDGNGTDLGSYDDITAIEKLVGKKKFAELLGDLITKPPGKPTLVSATDERPEISNHDLAVSELLSSPL